MFQRFRGTLIILSTVAAIGVAVALAFLPIGGQNESSAHVGTGNAHLELDMVQDAGGTWCNPVQTSTSHIVGSTYQVAVCVSDFIANTSVGGFQFDLVYNSALND